MRASRSAGEAEFGSWLSPERLEERTQRCSAIGAVVYEAGSRLIELIVQINVPSSKIRMLPDRSFADLAELARALVSVKGRNAAFGYIVRANIGPLTTATGRGFAPAKMRSA